MNAKETTNWVLTSIFLNDLPLGDNPKFPFNTNAGENEVIYSAGHIPDNSPIKKAKNPILVSRFI